MSKRKKLILSADEILFRCSSLGKIMGEAQGKSNMDKWKDAVEQLDKYKAEYELTANKQTKTAIAKLEKIEKLKTDIPVLELVKDKVELSETTKTNLIDIFVSARYGRREEIKSKYLAKGNAREEDSITLLSRKLKTPYKKNDERIGNEWIIGEPDIYQGITILFSDEILDTKTSWSAHTFFRSKSKELDTDYYWQGVGYMWLTGAKKHTVAFCLVNGTAQAIIDEKRRLSFAAGMQDLWGNPTEEFKIRCKQIDINHIYDLREFKEENKYFAFDVGTLLPEEAEEERNRILVNKGILSDDEVNNDINDIDEREWIYDIPKEERIFTFTFDRNEEDIQRAKKRIGECREWMQNNLFKK